MFIIYDRKHLVINRYTQGIMYVKNNSSYDINYIYVYAYVPETSRARAGARRVTQRSSSGEVCSGGTTMNAC